MKENEENIKDEENLLNFGFVLRNLDTSKKNNIQNLDRDFNILCFNILNPIKSESASITYGEEPLSKREDDRITPSMIKVLVGVCYLNLASNACFRKVHKCRFPYY